MVNALGVGGSSPVAINVSISRQSSRIKQLTFIPTRHMLVRVLVMVDMVGEAQWDFSHLQCCCRKVKRRLIRGHRIEGAFNWAEHRYPLLVRRIFIGPTYCTSIWTSPCNWKYLGT